MIGQCMPYFISLKLVKSTHEDKVAIMASYANGKVTGLRAFVKFGQNVRCSSIHSTVSNDHVSGQ